MATKNIYEVLEEVAAAPTAEEKQHVITRNHSAALNLVLRATFHPDIKFVFDKPVAYTPSDSPPGLGETSIHKEIWRLYLFEQNNPRVSPNLTLERKTELLTQILEGMEAKEAEVFMNMILKDLKVDGLDRELAMSVYPQLLD